MSTKKLSSARKYLATLRGKPLSFGQLLESTRICDKVSQVDLAKRAGLSRAYLCDIEKGRRNVSPELAARLAEELGYSVNQFVALAVEDQLKKAGFSVKVRLEAA